MTKTISTPAMMTKTWITRILTVTTHHQTKTMEGDLTLLMKTETMRELSERERESQVINWSLLWENSRETLTGLKKPYWKSPRRQDCLKPKCTSGAGTRRERPLEMQLLWWCLPSHPSAYPQVRTASNQLTSSKNSLTTIKRRTTSKWRRSQTSLSKPQPPAEAEDTNKTSKSQFPSPTRNS